MVTSQLSSFFLIFRTPAMTRAVWVSVVSVLLITACTSVQSDTPALELRSQGLNKTIMCPICPGESIDQSQATISLQMRDIVREKLADGWTDDQIRGFFVDRYGPSVLMEPPTEGFGLLAWIVPPVVVVVAIAAFLLAIRRMRGNGQRRQFERRDNAEPQSDLERYYDRIEAALEPRLSAVSVTDETDASTPNEPMPGIQKPMPRAQGQETQDG